MVQGQQPAHCTRFTRGGGKTRGKPPDDPARFGSPAPPPPATHRGKPFLHAMT
jgi:hypothetical protein